MLLLAIEGSGPIGSAALASAGPLGFRLESMAVVSGPGQADRLVGLIDELIKDVAVRYADLDLIAVGIGPGSFTGVRTTVAAGRALALATGKPVLPVTTFEAIAAASAASAKPQTVVLDARRGQVYAQRFDRDLRPVGEPVATSPESAAAAVGADDGLLGTGALLVAPHLPSRREGGIETAVADAQGVARAAHARLAEGAPPIAGFDLTPLYLRRPDALPMRAPFAAAGAAAHGP